MKQNTIVILIIALSVVGPLVTSLLLDWTFIKAHFSRELLIYFLMIIEVVIIALMLLYYLKKIS